MAGAPTWTADPFGLGRAGWWPVGGSTAGSCPPSPRTCWAACGDLRGVLGYWQTARERGWDRLAGCQGRLPLACTFHGLAPEATRRRRLKAAGACAGFPIPYGWTNARHGLAPEAYCRTPRLRGCRRLHAHAHGVPQQQATKPPAERDERRKGKIGAMWPDEKSKCCHL